MSRTFRDGSVALVLAGLVVCVAGQTAAGQVKIGARPDGLVSLIPPKAVFYLERRGHEAIREVFLKSNLGKMATDEAINQFVHDSRVRIGRMIVKGMFNLEGEEAIAHHHKLLHSLLKPFWYNPCAMYVVMDEKFERGPGLGFICMPGAKYRKECADALTELMKVGVPAKGRPGDRQEFTYKSGMIVWKGVAKGPMGSKLPAEAAERIKELKKRSVFLVSWAMPPLLLAATDLSAADAMETVLGKGGSAKLDSPSIKAVMGKTKLTDWAFRWHLDAEALTKMVMAKLKRQEVDQGPFRLMWALGPGKVRGVGGVGGYADNVFVRMTYIDAPAPGGGVLTLLKPQASYKRAFSMMPPDSTFALAGQIDPKALLKIVHESVAAAAGAGPPPAPGKPAPPVKLDEDVQKALKQVELLAEAADGSVGGFVTDLQSIAMGMIGEAGMPLGAVMGLKDRAKALRAIDELIKQAGGEKDPRPEEGEEAKPPRPKQYRKHTIRYLGEMVRLVVLKDRLVIALGDPALKAGIDTALDGTGGFEPDSKGARLAKLAGEGAFFFKMDLAALAKLGWPFLMQMAQSMPEHFPFASLPSTNKMVRMLGPEIAVFRRDAGGLLLSSRGKIPFATKFFIYPAIMFGMMMMF